MTLRTNPGHKGPLQAEDDLENTAELPVLDLNALDEVPGWARGRSSTQSGQGGGSGGTRRAPDDAARTAQLERQVEAHQESEQQLRDALAHSQTRIQELLAMAGRHSASLAEADAELTRLRATAGEESVALEESQRAREALEAELANVRKELHEVAGAGAGEAQAAALQALKTQLAAKEHTVHNLQESANAAGLYQRELQSELRAAEDQVRRRDAELAEAHEQLGSLRESEAQLRAAVRQAQAGERTARALAAERETLLQSIREELQALNEEAQKPSLAIPLPDAPGGSVTGSVAAIPALPAERAQQRWQLSAAVTRLLVRTDSDTESAHVLGERTSIGRSPDNDLQVDISSISRHHALILAGAAQTVIEDLRSTNGVRVNGRRVKRQPLRDGDTVVIGKAQFRFVLRAVVEAE